MAIIHKYSLHKLSRLLACIRGVRVVFHITYGIMLACFFPSLNPSTRRNLLKHWSRTLLHILHVRFEAHGYYHPADTHGRLLVANHISWLDIIALNAVVPAYFVAKSEIRNWPLLGWLCHRVGTLFVKRNIRRDTVRINREISGALKQGECIALFPEGTSTDGELPGHFHSSLLQVAIDLNVAVCPVAIRYHGNTGKANSDAAFVGDMSFVQSLWKILCSPSLHVTLFYLSPLPCTGKNRRLLASQAQGSIHMALAKFLPNHSVCVSNALFLSNGRAPSRRSCFEVS
jgi:1-acyl-sn-glycerol-3-phosphate acyltransferase